MKTPDLAGLLQRPTAKPTRKTASRSDTSAPSAESGAAEPDTRTDHSDDSSTAEADNAAPNSSTPRKQRSKPSKAKIGSTTQPATNDREYLRSIMVYLPRTLHQRLRDRAADEETTATALILTAVNATHHDLGQALARSDSTQGARQPGDLFAVPQERVAAEPRVQTTIRVTDAQYQALTDLTATHQVNRSKVIAAALGEYLPTLSEGTREATRRSG